MRVRTARGFTLIELVVVITILGILAAFAVPRFVALDGQARVSAVNGLTGSLRSAAALAHAEWLASGSPATVLMEGKTITILNGYPDGLTIPNTLVDTTGFNLTAAGSTSGTAVWQQSGISASGQCQVSYVPSASANSAPTITPETTCGQ